MSLEIDPYSISKYLGIACPKGALPNYCTKCGAPLEKRRMRTTFNEKDGTQQEVIFRLRCSKIPWFGLIFSGHTIMEQSCLLAEQPATVKGE